MFAYIAVLWSGSGLAANLLKAISRRWKGHDFGFSHGLAVVVFTIYGFKNWSETRYELDLMISETEIKGKGNVEDTSIFFDTLLLGVMSFLTTAVIGLLILIFTSNKKKFASYAKASTTQSVKAIEFADEYKKCPDCAEQIRFKARKCRYCGFEFESF